MECAQLRQKWTSCVVIGAAFRWMSKNGIRNLNFFFLRWKSVRAVIGV